MSSIKRRIEQLERKATTTGLTKAQWQQLARSMPGGAILPKKSAGILSPIMRAPVPNLPEGVRSTPRNRSR
jgi:hypothetical protein